MAKSRLKSSLAFVLLVVLLVANVAITPVSTAGPSVGISGGINILPEPTSAPPQQSQPPQQQPSQSQQQPPQSPTPAQQSASQQQSSPPSQSPDKTDSSSRQTTSPAAQNTPGNTPTTQAPAAKSTGIVEVGSATVDGNVVFVTSTSYSSLPVPTGVPSSAAAGASNSGGGESSANVVTAAIVVGSVVVAAALGIWIFRKWKLSPSRDFKEKIQPVNFSPSRDHNSDTVFLRELNEP